jgi:hypothetical protein
LRLKNAETRTPFGVNLRAVPRTTLGVIETYIGWLKSPETEPAGDTAKSWYSFHNGPAERSQSGRFTNPVLSRG